MLRITRPYSGLQKIYDRTKGENGEYTEAPVVLLSKDGYSPKYVNKITEGEDGTKKRTRTLQPGKTFEVQDEAYVLQRHGAILEKA